MVELNKIQDIDQKETKVKRKLLRTEQKGSKTTSILKMTREQRELMKKSVLTLFILLTPILILGITTEILVKILIFFYEAVILKNFIDTHYTG